MAEKKRVHETEMMALTSLRLMLGDVPALDPDGWHKAGQKLQKLDPKMEGTVKRLIEHFKDEKFWSDNFSRQS
jgi:hypothetical protein